MKKVIFIFLLSIIMSLIFLEINQPKKIIIENKVKTKDAKMHYNSDIIGNIRIKNTGINYELVQSQDNTFYLNHNSNKEEDKNGSVFLDYRNNLEDKKLLIYGHNSEYQWAPFKELENYLDSNYYNKNKYINLTLNNINYKYKIFSIMITSPYEYRHTKLIFTEEEYVELINWLKEQSIYNTNINVNANDKIIILQTCYYNPKNSYLLISAKGE